jgi:hypothetical protein
MNVTKRATSDLARVLLVVFTTPKVAWRKAAGRLDVLAGVLYYEYPTKSMSIVPLFELERKPE